MCDRRLHGAVLLALLCCTKAQPPPGTSSLTFVFDITGSMFDDLEQVREGAKKIYQTVMSQRERLIYNYILVPFHDPDLGEIIDTTDALYFQRQLGKVHVYGGGDCPEMTLTGIKAALERSLPSSFIYVFTDARSKDFHLENQVLNLIQEKQSSVVFVMTGDCGNRTHAGFRTYEKIAAASFGQVFHLEKSDVSAVLEYVRYAVKQKKVHLSYEVRDHGGTMKRQMPVDKHMTELTLSLSGDKDDEDFLDIQLKDPKGNIVDKNAYNKEGGTIDLKNVKLIRLKDPMPGNWQITTHSRLKHTLRVFGHGTIDFKYGFGSRPLERIELARPRPVSGQNTYLMVNMTGLIPPGTPVEISLIDYYGNTLYTNPASPTKTNPHMYFVGPFVPPKGLYFVQVKGVDDEDYEFQRIAPTAIGSVDVAGPRAYMADRTTAFANQAVNLTCSVESGTAFQVYWKRGEQTIGGPLFYSGTDTAHWYIPEVTNRERGEYTCQVVSAHGNHTARTFLESREPPPHIVNLRNTTVSLGHPAYIHCQTQSLSTTDIRWMRHGQPVQRTSNTIVYPNGTLLVWRSSRSDAGGYECQARNSGGMTTQGMILKVVEKPTARVTPSTQHFVAGTQFNISCYTSGDPRPEVTWLFRGRPITIDRKFYITPDNTLIVREPTAFDAGQYECRVQNTAGSASDVAGVQAAIPPRIQLQQKKTMISKGDSITFLCMVLEGAPSPRITWYKYNRELTYPIHEYMKIDGPALHIIGAQDQDAGMYSCVAENMAGRDIQTSKINIGSVPTIVPSPETVRVNIGRQITLQCRAIGQPPPTISWTRNGVHIESLDIDRYTLLHDGNLLIVDADLEDQTQFTCVAKNDYGEQSKTTTVIITGMIAPVLGHVPPEEQLIEGEDLHLSCIVVLGTPKPEIRWYKDGKPLELSPSIIIEGGGTGLLLRRGNPKDEGMYTCAAVSPAGNATLNINVQLIKAPEFITDQDEYEMMTSVLGVPTLQTRNMVVKEGGTIDIPCTVKGSPNPVVTWSLDGRIITINKKEHTILPDNTLRLHKAEKAASGRYICSAVNAGGTAEQVTYVGVLAKPEIQPGQTSYNLIKGIEMIIPCDVQGEPQPQIKWYLNDELVNEGWVDEDGALHIDEANENHKGELKCVAENNAGRDERIVTVTVHTPPVINGPVQTTTVTSKTNDTVVLPCPADAHPPPKRIWSHEGEKISDGEQFYGATAHILPDGSLQIENSNPMHDGVFFCHVSNLAGEDSITYNLKVQEPPRIVSDTPGTLDILKGFTIEIICRGVGIPQPLISWEKDGYQVFPGGNIGIDTVGTLRVYNADIESSGSYKCIATNPAGKDVKVTKVVVQDPPTILQTTMGDTTAVAGDKVELRCHVRGDPPPIIEWQKKGVDIVPDDNMHVTSEGVLVIHEASKEDASVYTCKATNPAGTSEKLIQLSVLSAPEIPDSDVVSQEIVRLNNSFSLYCPVFSMPLPEISWQLDDSPIYNDYHVRLSDDHRRLHVTEAKVKNAGSYKCIARNAAGESSKTFDVEVVVPLNIDESKYQRKITKLAGSEITMGCPVSGLPDPEITWIVEGRLAQAGQEAAEGITVSSDGTELLINTATADHSGIYHCVAQNKAGTLDVDVELKVLAPPQLGPDETISVIKGRAISLSCDVKSSINEKVDIDWAFQMRGVTVDHLPENFQLAPGSHRGFIVDANLENSGRYTCIAQNEAGTTKKNFDIIVYEAPEWVDSSYEQNVHVIHGEQLVLHCPVTGNPSPTVDWRRDGEPVAPTSYVTTEYDQKITVFANYVHSGDKSHSRYTCHASNEAGSISRDFFVQSLAAPEVVGAERRYLIEVEEGETATLNCSIISNGEVAIEWRKGGRSVQEEEGTVSEDGTRLLILKARKELEDYFTCTASNAAGTALIEFKLVVLTPPRMRGPLVETVEVVEGDTMALNCEFEGSPTPSVEWTKDRSKLTSSTKVLNDDQTLVIENMKASDGGDYKCSAHNKVGGAEKSFKVHVIEKPEVDANAGKIDEIEVLLGRPFTFDCPVKFDAGIERSWTKHELPVVSGMDNVQVMADGRHLHLIGARKEDEGTFTCTARNRAGETQKSYRLKVLVPPTIVNEGGEFTVIENNSLVLPCEVEGEPSPKIIWNKDGRPVSALGSSVRILNDGQQFKISRANKQHKGSYACHASNKVGSAEISFDVDVITRPQVSTGIKDTVEAIEGETALFKCPIQDKNFKGVITWLKDFQPIKIDGHMYTTSQNNRKLHLHNATVRDEAGYSCRIKNDAGETRVDYKLIVLVPPTIIMLDKDKNRTVVENKTVTFSCPATGKPEPTILWFKDGEPLHENNISKVVKTAQIIKNEIKISRVNAKDSGRFSCEAKNVAGSVEQDVALFVMTPPKIEREGLPSDIEEVADRTATLSCPVYGKPAPTVTWLKNGRPLSDEHKIKTSANGQKLYFLKLSKEESDRYTCIAINAAGEDKRDFNVKMLEAPSFDGPNIVRRLQSNEGRLSVLNCPASGSPAPTITWLRDGVTLNYSSRHVLLENGRQLQISNTQPEDHARYTCIATNSVGSDDLETTLDVVSIPKIAGDEHEKLEVVENERKDLACEVNETDSSVEIEWQKAGESIGPDQLRENTYLQIPSSGRRLHILSSRITDGGRYSCVVRNPAGEDRKTFELKVLVPPTISEATSSSDIQTIVPGQTINIECDVEGNPPPQVEWWFQDKQLNNGSSGVTLNDNNETLTIDNPNDSFGGRYECRAKNKAGEAKRDFIIKLTGPPILDQGMETLDVAVTDSITLTCKVLSGSGNITVKWLVNGKPVENGDLSSTVQIDERQVKISNARLSDAGQYICVAANEGGEARKTFDLSVLEPPRFLDMTNRHPSIVVGRPLTLDCSVSGTPKPVITWMKDGLRLNISQLDPERFMNDKQQLHIEGASIDDAGRYSCLAENRQGRAEKDLTVAILKPPQMNEKNMTREVSEGQPITLHCPTEDSTSEITWTKHGIPITTSQKLQTSVNRDKLFVMNAEPSDTAVFACIAKNEAGEDMATFGLTVTVAPKILSATFRSLDVILNQTVEIECETSGVPPPEIHWYFDGKPLSNHGRIQFDNQDSLLRLNGVTEEDAGRYSCKAENKVGKAEADSFLSVLSPPRVVMFADDMKVIAGTGYTIRCEVFGNPQPDVSWTKNGKAVHTTQKSQTYLHINKAKTEDAGKYSCIASNRAGEHRASANLQVLVPPTIETEERVLQAKEGSDITIDCAVTGTPLPLISWLRDGNPIHNETSSKLVLIATNATDAGKYTCTARNEAGSVTADFAIDVLIKPKFKEQKKIVKVVDGGRARLECKVDGHPPPTIKWLKGGRAIDMSNLILSPRGETLMILKAKRADAGSYSCIAKNSAGEAEMQFTVDVLTPPHIDETIDQSPRIVQGKDLHFSCPVLGNPEPKVEWKRNDVRLKIGGRFTIIDKKHLHITNASKEDEGRFTCHATNEAGTLDTDYKPEVIAPPKFHRSGENVFEVIAGETITMDCKVETDSKLYVNWFRGDQPLHLNENMKLSPDFMELTIKKTSLSDGGKYMCRANNTAGSADIDLILKVLVPPKIDRSNIIGNPLAIVDKNIILECPVSGIPQPAVTWMKDGVTIEETNARVKLNQNNQTLTIDKVIATDQARYTCIATNKGGTAEQDFNLEVLTPPALEQNTTQTVTKREGDVLTLTCPVIKTLDGSEAADVSWIKDGRPLDAASEGATKISTDSRRLTIQKTSLTDAGSYTCVAMNRAGESTLDFTVEILSPPIIDSSRNDQSPKVTVGNPVTLFCPVSGHPFPSIKWMKDGKEVVGSDNYRILDNGQGIEIFGANREDGGTWTCTAENDAGTKDLEINLDVWVPPTVNVTSDGSIRALGQGIVIYCQVDGNPGPRISWHKGGQQIFTDGNGARISLKGTRLDIPRLDRTDVGDYTCIAENDAGTAEASIHVDVLVPPMINRDNVDMSPRLPTGQTLTLLCESQGKPLPEMKWFVNETEITDSTEGIFLGTDGKYIQISNISLEDRGAYRCVSLNVAGNDTLLYTVDVVQSPAILNGGTQQVIEGEVASIECEASGHPPPLVSWLRNGVRLETGLQGVRYMADGRILKVVDSRSSDSGIYVCMATNEAGTAQQAYTLEVLVSPRIVSKSSIESSVPIGQPFSLKCGVKGYPEPDIHWSLNDVEITSGIMGNTIAEDGTLFVSSAKGRNLNYRCTVKNDAGTDTVEYLIRTISAPVLTKDGERTVNSTEGEPTILTCDIEGDTPSIQWLKNGAPLASGSNVVYNEDKSTVSIQSSKLNDEGDYSCVAVNSAGNATQKIQLYVGVPPRITDKPRRLVVKQGELAELWCEAVGVPQPHIVWMRDNIPLGNTAVDDHSESRKTSALFKSITPEQAGVYTCKAENWAGTSYKDVDLVVLIPPTITPEKMNVSINPREIVYLPCNASGIPEPVVSWVKAPNTEIVANEKYQLLGTSLAIRNVLPEDDGFYHCVAKSDAGQALGSRKLVVLQPEKEQKVIWVECDEDGRPIKTTYMPSRGDVPDDHNSLLPWKETLDLSLNGTNGVIIRCLPGPRAPRAPITTLNSAPKFVHQPKDTSLYISQSVTLTCSAEGPPVPQIYWSLNGEVLKDPKPSSGFSKIIVTMSTPESGGNYTCHAKNSVGQSESTAEIVYAEPPDDDVDYGQDYEDYEPSTTPSPNNKRSIAVLDCLDRSQSTSSGVTWEHRGRPVDVKTEPLIILNNGSLVILDTDSIPEEELSKYTCRIRNRRKKNSINKMLVDESPPKVAVPTSKVQVQKGDPVIIDCILEEGQPLTTDLRWMKDSTPLTPDEAVYILPNNSLYIVEADDIDTAEYKCRAANALGRSFDDVKLDVQDDIGDVGFISGIEPGDETNQPMQILLPYHPSNAPKKETPRSVLGELIDTNIANLLPNGTHLPEVYIKEGDYQFSSGERVKVKQYVNNSDPVNPVRTTTVEGKLPEAKPDDPIGIERANQSITETLPGTFISNGKAVMKIGNETIDVHTHEEYKYNTTDHTIVPGKSIRLELDLMLGSNGKNTTSKSVENDDCGEGFILSEEQICIDIDECTDNVTICDEFSECVNFEGGYECEKLCETGFRPRLDDGTCVDIDECEKDPCNEGQICVNTDGAYECTEENPCGPGFRYDHRADVCEDVNECDDNPCSQDLRCVNQLGSFVCLCKNGHPPMNGTCNVGRHKAHNITSSRHHKCEQGYQWDGHECADIDECSLDMPCEWKCINTDGSFECRCPDGYEMVDNNKCKDIDDCSNSTICAGTGGVELCFNTFGSYQCLSEPCPQNYHFHGNHECHHVCHDCHKPVIQLHFLPVTSGLPVGTHLARLTAYDKTAKVVNDTFYTMTDHQDDEKSEGRTIAGPFGIKTEHGRAIILSSKPLPSGKTTQLRVFAESETNSDSHFLLHVHVGEHPF